MSKKMIYIVSHKNSNPFLDDIRCIIKVGNSKDFNSRIVDSTGDNISNKNSSYCELTALYWIWKNDKTSDIVGLEHYRRQFLSPKIKKNKNKYLTSIEIEKILNEHDAIVAKKWHTKKKNLAESIKYSNNHVENDFKILESVIKNDYSGYYDFYKKLIYDETGFNPFNMIVCKKKLFDEYCEWLFELLEKVEQKIDVTERIGNTKRVFGYMSEILLIVWIRKNNINCYEADVFFDSQNKLKNFAKLCIRNLKHIIRK